jgi:hypothetical protein
MTHPITLPPELVRQWYLGAKAYPPDQWVTDVAAQAARWGSDQELEACCEALDNLNDGYWSSQLRAARRPKPPSLKEQALKALKVLPTPDGQVTLDITDLNTIRRALEALPQ